MNFKTKDWNWIWAFIILYSIINGLGFAFSNEKFSWWIWIGGVALFFLIGLFTDFMGKRKKKSFDPETDSIGYPFSKDGLKESEMNMDCQDCLTPTDSSTKELDVVDEEEVKPLYMTKNDEKSVDKLVQEAPVGVSKSKTETNKKSITQKVLEYLQEHGEITSDICKEKFGYNRLTDIISELRKRGCPIHIEKLPEFNEDGSKNHPNKVKYIWNKI